MLAVVIFGWKVGSLQGWERESEERRGESESEGRFLPSMEVEDTAKGKSKRNMQVVEGMFALVLSVHRFHGLDGLDFVRRTTAACPGRPQD